MFLRRWKHLRRRMSGGLIESSAMEFHGHLADEPIPSGLKSARVPPQEPHGPPAAAPDSTQPSSEGDKDGRADGEKWASGIWRDHSYECKPSSPQRIWDTVCHTCAMRPAHADPRAALIQFHGQRIAALPFEATPASLGRRRPTPALPTPLIPPTTEATRPNLPNSCGNGTREERSLDKAPRLNSASCQCSVTVAVTNLQQFTTDSSLLVKGCFPLRVSSIGLLWINHTHAQTHQLVRVARRLKLAHQTAEAPPGGLIWGEIQALFCEDR